jgi:hypothetical protein
MPSKSELYELLRLRDAEIKRLEEMVRAQTMAVLGGDKAVVVGEFFVGRHESRVVGQVSFSNHSDRGFMIYVAEYHMKHPSKTTAQQAPRLDDVTQVQMTSSVAPPIPAISGASAQQMADYARMSPQALDDKNRAVQQQQPALNARWLGSLYGWAKDWL